MAVFYRLVARLLIHSKSLDVLAHCSLRSFEFELFFVLFSGKLILRVLRKLPASCPFHVTHQFISMVAEHDWTHQKHRFSETRIFSEQSYMRSKLVDCVTSWDTNSWPHQHRLICLPWYFQIFLPAHTGKIHVLLKVGIEGVGLFNLFLLWLTLVWGSGHFYYKCR